MRPLAVAVAVLALLAALPAAAAATTIGISDSDATTFTDPSWAGLNVTTARAVVPYDVALTQPVAGTPAGDARMNFDAWITNAAAAGVAPLVAFQTSLGPNQAAPSPARYKRAMRAFLSTYPSVRLLAPWNEPNFRSAATPTRSSTTRHWRPSTTPSCAAPARAAPCSRASWPASPAIRT